MSVNLNLEGEGLLYSASITAFQAGQIIAFLNNGEALGGQPGVSGGGTMTALPYGPGESMVPTLREVLDNSGAKGNPQRIVVAGYYATAKERSETFSSKDVKSVFRKAGESVPQNFTRDMKKSVGLGYIDSVSGKRDTYYLTDAGLRYIANGFPASGETVATKRKTGKTSRTGTASREQINQELNERLKEGTNGQLLRDYIAERKKAFNSKATNKATIVATWLLDNLDWEGVTTSDLYTVYRYLGEPSGSIEAQLVNGKARDNYFGHSDKGKYFLSQKGEDYGRHHSVNDGTEEATA